MARRWRCTHCRLETTQEFEPGVWAGSDCSNIPGHHWVPAALLPIPNEGVDQELIALVQTYNHAESAQSLYDIAVAAWQLGRRYQPSRSEYHRQGEENEKLRDVAEGAAAILDQFERGGPSSAELGRKLRDSVRAWRKWEAENK